MAVVGDGDAAQRALVQVKGVDDLYPLTGSVILDPAVSVAEALSGSGGLPGGIMDKVLVDRLGLAVGDSFRLGVQEFRLGAVLLREPDSAAGGFPLARA
jgi:putative ABC transport system permease protein